MDTNLKEKILNMINMFPNDKDVIQQGINNLAIPIKFI
jgi:hypothetical protein